MKKQQQQEAGDNSQQIQANTVIVYTGIDEKRAREIVDEKLHDVMAMYSQEAHTIAESRIKHFADDLIPKMVKDNLLDELKDPSIQILLSEAQKTAASTERDTDYALLSELLIQRVHKGNDRNTRAGISRAVEILDKISDEALLGLTIAHSLSAFVPAFGNIENGIKVLAGLFDKVIYSVPPKGELWLENLEILDAIRIIPLGKLKKTDLLFAERLSGFVDIGIEKDSENHQNALVMLKNASLPEEMLYDHELREGFVRLLITNVNKLDSVIVLQEIQLTQNSETVMLPFPQPLTPDQKLVLGSIYSMYNKDTKLRNENIIKLMGFFEKYESLNILRSWWDSIPSSFSITSVGRVLANANAQRCDPKIPSLD
jgi:hypothetical protein